MTENRPSKTWIPGYVAGGYLMLLGSSYWDSVRGPLIPVIAEVLNLPYQKVGWFMAAGNLAAVGVLFGLTPLLKRFGEKVLGLASAIFCVFTALFALTVDGFGGLLILGILVGTALAVQSTLCSIYTLIGTPPASRSRTLVGNHLMYSLGSFAAPLISNAVLGAQGSWRDLIAGAGVYFLLLGLFITAAVPKTHNEEPEPPTKARLGGFEIYILVLFSLYVVSEVASGAWLVTYLESRGISQQDGSTMLSNMFIVMALSRLACVAFMKQKWEGFILVGSCVLALLGHVLGRLWHEQAFLLMGFFGPFYPIFLARISRNLPNIWRSLLVKAILAIQLSLGLVHIVIGTLKDQLGIGPAFLVPPIGFVIVIAMLWQFFRLERAR